MHKHQLIVAGVALAAVVGLSVLPKSIVETDIKDMKTAPAADRQAAPDSNVVRMHNLPLSDVQQQQLRALQAEFRSGTDKNRLTVVLDSMAALYRGVNQLDSIAYYSGILADRYPSVSLQMRAADAYYEAFGFAISPEKGKQLGEKARSYYKQVLAADPSRLDAKTKMGMTYIVSDAPMQGIALIREVLEEDPQNQFALFNLGVLSMQSGQYDKAIARFEQLLGLNPQDTKAQFYLAMSLAEAGRKQEAIKWFDAVKKADQDPAIQAAVDDYLQKLK
ncbi:tetratricopeptide repeat protein [Rhodoflexus caldus]|uniref:tetratricopeptide repeat protein n=1 Tax=Rhodoflexus caldus TaxID=2891236 RepID=UPI002029E255|nr:tetratricopeptide repeat protein [Rhodoflexus caldus]